MISDVSSSDRPSGGATRQTGRDRTGPAASPSAITAILQRNIRILLALNAVSVAVTVLLFVGLFFSWSATSELNQIKGQLAGLQQFEKRISGNVDLMNAGIQSRLSKLDKRISQIQSGVRLIRTETVGPDLPVDQLRTVVDEDIDFFHPSTAAMMFSPAMTAQDVGGFGTLGAGPRVTVSAAAAPSQGSALFRRIVTADGKVRYEKRDVSEN